MIYSTNKSDIRSLAESPNLLRLDPFARSSVSVEHISQEGQSLQLTRKKYTQILLSETMKRRQRRIKTKSRLSSF